MPCPVCGETTTRTGARGFTPVYCSVRCRRRAYYLRTVADGRAAATQARQRAAREATSARAANAKLARDRTTAAGLPTEVDVARWMAHPYALDDLFRVICGTRRSVIDRERAVLRALEDTA